MATSTWALVLIAGVMHVAARDALRAHFDFTHRRLSRFRGETADARHKHRHLLLIRAVRTAEVLDQVALFHQRCQRHVNGHRGGEQ
jgi:hypothetical protein